jgi:uncharacterized protein (TIGR02147 family)
MKSELSKLLFLELQKRKKKNARYSLRSFARDLELSPSMVSRFLAGERQPSVETLPKLLERLGIDETVKQQLLMATVKNQEYKIPKDEEYIELSLKQREQINDWIFSAMMELFRSKNRKLTISSVAKTLQQPVKEIEKRVQVLISLGLLRKTESGFKTLSMKQSSVGLGKVVNKIHEGYLGKAIEALHHEERDISGSTILIHPKRLAEARVRIKDFRRSLSAFLAVKPEENEEQLYRLQIALFSLENK